MTDVASERDRQAPFIDQVPMERDTEALFPGDRGVLEPDVRRVLTRLLQRRFLQAERNRDDWTVLLDNQPLIESRLADVFIRLVVDTSRGVAYKEQVRSDELEIPILLKDDAYSREETLTLVYLRVVYQRETTAGEASARVDIEEIEQTVLTYFTEADGNTARRQKAIRRSLERLRSDGIVEEDSEGRYLITPLVEIVLSSQKMSELTDWLQSRGEARADADNGMPVEAHDGGTPDESDDEEDSL